MTNNRRKVISILGVVLTLAVFVGCTSNTTKEKDTEEIQKLIERVVEKGDEEFAVEYSYKKVSTFAEEKKEAVGGGRKKGTLYMQEEANLITIYDFSAEKGVEYLQFDGGEWQASRLPKELTEEYKNVFTVDTGIEKSLVKKVLSDETDGNIRKIKFEADNLGEKQAGMIIEYYENENPEKLKADKELKQYFDTFKSEPQIIEVWIDIENELLVKVLEEYTMKDILLHYILEQPYEEVPKETFVEKNYIYGSEVKEIKVPENVEIIDSTESVEK